MKYPPFSLLLRRVNPITTLRSGPRGLCRATSAAVPRNDLFIRNRLGKLAPFGCSLIYNSKSKINYAPLLHTYSSKEGQTPKPIFYWYLISSALVFATVVVGGLTRLTESGLSIVEWNVIKGMKAPSSQQEWEEEFEKYKKFPEYEILNHNMTLSEFKKIFYMEWLHRNLGRAVGMIFFIPGLYFGYKGMLSRQMKINFSCVSGLIAFQGLFGWLMVKTGLSENLRNSNSVPRVDSRALAGHLITALTIYSIQLYTAMNMIPKMADVFVPREIKIASSKLWRPALCVTGLIFATAFTGALVAGIDAGLIYNEFPYMGGKIIPDDMWALSKDPPDGNHPLSWWHNLYMNSVTTQFNHRAMGVMTASAVIALWIYTKRLNLPPTIKLSASTLAAISLVQVSLGISTLLHHVPVHLASAHQAGSITLLSCALWLLSRVKRFK